MRLDLTSVIIQYLNLKILKSLMATIKVKVNNRPLEVMADSGAAFTCIRPEDATHLPMSGQLIRTIGFEGVKQLIPLTEPIELCYKNMKTTLPILVSEHTPIALLGRDALCRLNCTIKCTPDGCLVEVPDRKSVV